MPEISRFYGIVIRMFVETGAPHHRPHFHAYYQGRAAIYAFDELARIAGLLPVQQERLVLAWAEIHHGELLKCWLALQGGKAPSRIEPLR